MIIKLAYKNIRSAGLRTWLNVAVLSFAFVLIIWTQGLYDGMSRQMLDAKINSEVGSGQFWVKGYDPYDPFTIEDAHAQIPVEAEKLIEKDKLVPVIIRKGAIFPNGRIIPVIVKGIPPNQKVLDFPSVVLESDENTIRALIGGRMAENSGLQKGDFVTLRWRDINGTFDAVDIKIAEIMSTTLQTIDAGQIWLPFDEFQKMLSAENEASILTLGKNAKVPEIKSDKWIFKDQDELVTEITEFIKAKESSSYFMYFILMGMALLAIFDTQVLAIFKRRKEMGTMMALGMTRKKVIALFTLEGCIHGILAILVGALYGIPLLAYFQINGLGLPSFTEQFGLSMGAAIYPVYGVKLFIATSIILFISVLIVSYLPTRKITKLEPTEALRGKVR